MYKILVFVLAIAFLLRTISLASIPSGFTPDEASFGYDAYSLLKTGKDQWGVSFPVVLESFGDFKLPLYAYLDIPFVWLLGLNVLSVRLPNAIIGVGAVYATFLLTKEIFNVYLVNQKNKKNLLFQKGNLVDKYKEYLTLLPAFLLAISSWHIMMSRGAFEANLTTFFLTFAIYLFLRGVASKSQKYLFLCSVFFGLNVFSYHSARFVTPIILLTLIVVYLKELRKISFKKLLPAIMSLVIFALLVGYSFTLGAGRRAADVSIAAGALEAQAEDRLSAINSGTSPLMAKLLHNKYLVIADRFLFNYKSYWSFDFLFKNGPRETTYGMIPGIGVLKLLVGVFVGGFFIFIVKHPNVKILWVVLIWLLLGFVPASLSTGIGHAANRAEVILPSFQIAAGLGVLGFYSLLKFKTTSRGVKVYGLILLTIFLIESLITFNAYLSLSPIESSRGMLYGNLEVSNWLREKNEFDKLIISRKLSEPHIYVAFAEKWDPRDYQKQTRDWKKYQEMNLMFLDQLPEYSLGQYTFINIENNKLTSGKILLVGKPEEFPLDVNVVNSFYYPNGTPAIYVVQGLNNVYAKAY